MCLTRNQLGERQYPGAHADRNRASALRKTLEWRGLLAVVLQSFRQLASRATNIRQQPAQAPAAAIVLVVDRCTRALVIQQEVFSDKLPTRFVLASVL